MTLLQDWINKSTTKTRIAKKSVSSKTRNQTEPFLLENVMKAINPRNYREQMKTYLGQ
jgi:hypothetical protein